MFNIGDFVFDTIAGANVQIMQRVVTSSTDAVRQSLKCRLRVLLEEETRDNIMSESDWDERDIEAGDADATEAMSLDRSAEIEELKIIISVAKQAEFHRKCFPH